MIGNLHVHVLIFPQFRQKVSIFLLDSTSYFVKMTLTFRTSEWLIFSFLSSSVKRKDMTFFWFWKKEGIFSGGDKRKCMKFEQKEWMSELWCGLKENKYALFTSGKTFFATDCIKNLSIFQKFQQIMGAMAFSVDNLDFEIPDNKKETCSWKCRTV